MMKYKCVKQLDETDCGATCIATICKYYGKEINISLLRKLANVDKRGSNMLGLYKAAKKLGFDAKGLQGNINDLYDSKINTPFIAHMLVDGVLEHYVVVFEIKEEQIIIGDPAHGVITYSKEKFTKEWRGHILTLIPNKTFEKGGKKEKPLLRYFGLIKEQKGLFASITGISVIITFLSIITSYYVRYFIDDIIPNSLVSKIMSLSVLMVLLYLLMAGISYARNYMLSKLTKKLNLRIMIEYIEHLLNVPLNFYSKRTTGDIISRFSDADNIREAISNATLTVVLDTFLVVIGNIILLTNNVKLFAISLVIMTLYGISVAIFNKPIKNITQELRESDSKTTSSLIETIEGIEIIKAFSNEEKSSTTNSGNIKELMQKSFVGSLMFSGQSIISQTVISVGQIALLCVGGIDVINNNISLGTLMTFYTLFSLFIDPVKNIVDLQPIIQKAKVSAQRIFDVLSVEAEMRTKEINSATLTLKNKNIEFDNLTFQYGERKPVLNNVSFTIDSGEKVGIIGPSGSGKSTLIKLLLNFYDIADGDIYIDDKSIAEISKKDLRDLISYVPQNTFLFRGSVLDNIKYGNETISNDEVKNICARLNLEKFIEVFPFGYDTIIEEKGSNLSGGQRQIIAVIRAVIHDGDLLILDEATSNMDVVTEKIIDSAIDEVYKNKTMIIIAHRLSTILKCDKIVILDSGRVLGVGSHQQLLQNNAYYRKLWNQQTEQ